MVETNNAVEASVLPFAIEEMHQVKLCPVGAKLRTARLASRLSVEAIGTLTRIRPCYIEALEEGRLDGFAAPIYAIGFARNYAQAIGLDPEWAAAGMRSFIADNVTRWRRSGWLS